MGTYIVAAAKIVDGAGSLGKTQAIRKRAEALDLKVVDFHIAPLGMSWTDQLPDNYFRSGCAAIEAILEARKLLEKGEVDLVVINGEENIKTRYKGHKEQRDRDFQIYGEGRSPLTEYNRVTSNFLKKHGYSKDQFKDIAKDLFDNYWRTWVSINPDSARPDARPNKRWFDYISEYFRGVDCANPSVDFSGQMILAKEEVLEKMQLDICSVVEIAGCDLQTVGDDGPEHIDEIVSYKHLAKAYIESSQQAGIDFGRSFLDGKALLEIYTCYPVVPIAFLLSTEMVKDVERIKEFLLQYEVTVTGGLNLGKAAWNCTTLNNIISMSGLLKESSIVSIGGVHSNGSLGHRQAFLILKSN